MLPGAVIAAQGAEIVVAERLDAGFGIDLGGREIQVVEGFRFLQFDHAVSASAGCFRVATGASNRTNNSQYPYSTQFGNHSHWT